ncbi:hypothetical protein, partial [Nocardioides albidus]|uniref:hypothetical protein n=1 Tax=Nocardioides albidus TaxID=1517589 RepID=UPI0013051736
ASLTAVAEQLEATMPEAVLNDRRVAAAALLLNPTTQPDLTVGPVKPRVKVYLHLYADSPIARLEG